MAEIGRQEQEWKEVICQEDWDFLSDESDSIREGVTNRKQNRRKCPLWTWKFRSKDWEHQKR